MCVENVSHYTIYLQKEFSRWVFVVQENMKNEIKAKRPGWTRNDQRDFDAWMRAVSGVIRKPNLNLLL